MLPHYQRQRDARRLTKDAERERMEQLARERQARTPERIVPAWIERAWRRLLS